MEFKIRGIQFDADLTDADIIDAYEEGLKDFNTIVTSGRNGNISNADFVRELCGKVRDWLDDVLGDGSGEDVLPNDSMTDAFSAMRDMVNAENMASDELKAIEAEFVAARNNTSGKKPNRAERRQNEQRRKKSNGRKSSKNKPYDEYSPDRVAQ